MGKNDGVVAKVIAGLIFRDKMQGNSKGYGSSWCYVRRSNHESFPSMKTLFRAASVSTLALLIAVPAICAKQDSLVISVHSQASSSYKRRTLPDGNITRCPA